MAVARPLSDLPRFIAAVAVESKEAAAEASNAAALVVVRAIRQQLPTRRLRSRATLGRKRTGTGVNFAYLEASAKTARFRPTALVVGRGPVHILENQIGPHRITLGVRRGPDGRITDIVQNRGNLLGDRRGRLGPSLSQVGFSGGTISVRHPGVQRTSGPFRRGLAVSSQPAQSKWRSVFLAESVKVKGF